MNGLGNDGFLWENVIVCTDTKESRFNVYRIVCQERRGHARSVDAYRKRGAIVHRRSGVHEPLFLANDLTLVGYEIASGLLDTGTRHTSDQVFFSMLHRYYSFNSFLIV